MKAVLAVRVGRAGDMVIVTAALRAILKKHPDAELHLLTSPDGRRVLRHFDPRLTCLLIYDRRGIGNWWQRRRLRREIADGGYRYLYCFETNPSFAALLDGAAGEKHVLAASAELMPFPERCLRLVDTRPEARQWLWLPVADAGRRAAHAMLAAGGIDDTHFVIGLHPSFSGLGKIGWRARDARRRKTWPLASFARLVELLVSSDAAGAKGMRVICDLLPEERPLGEALVAATGGRVTLFTAPPDFERYKATIARMNLLVTPDTGPMHIAAAVGTPLVALFHGRDPRDCGPYTDPRSYAVVRAEDMPQPERGLAAIPPETVYQACRKFLATKAR